MTRSRIVAALSIAALIIAGTYLWFFMVPPNTVVLRDDGFHPRTLTVAAGETVTFITKRDKYFWPASDFHPTHTLFPSFDPKTPIAPGDAWSFTFDTPGTYTFHDHLAAYYFGVIQVRNADGTVPAVCQGTEGFTCWQNDIFLALGDGGLKAAFARVRELYATDPAFVQSCHYLAHNIGLASYQLYLENPNSIYSTDATACASGFYHGFMEGFLGTGSTAREAAKICDDVGEKVGDKTPDARLQCYHGIGHGAMETAVASTGQFQGIDPVVEEALRICEAASEGEAERYRCASGMYNAIANFLINGAYKLSVTTTDPIALCARQPETYKEACYGNMNSALYWAVDNSLARALPSILGIEEGHRVAALHYIVGLAMIDRLAGAYSTEALVRDCRSLSAGLHDVCIFGAVSGLIEHGTPGVEYEDAFALCRDALWNEAERTICFDSAYYALPGTYGEEKAEAICRALEPERQAECLE